MAVATGTAILTAAILGTAAGTGLAISGGQAQKKAQKKAQEFADQQQQQSIAEQKRLEEKYQLTPGELATYESRTTEAARRAGIGGEELLKEAGPTTRGLIDRVGRRAGQTGEELFREEGDLAKQLYGEATSEDPLAMFKPELELTRQMVNQEANRRGVFGGLPEGGIRFEQMGRAGVDLAIKSARERLAQRNAIMSTVLNLSTGARQEAGVVGERALSASERARAELDAILQASKSREVGGTTLGAQVREGGVGRSADIYSSVYGTQAGEAAATKKAGLEEIGKSVGNYSDYLAMGGTSSASPTNYDTILSQQKKPFWDLEERSGRTFVTG